MPLHEAGVLTVITAATADNAFAQLWNPATNRVRIREIGGFSTAATASKVALKRTTARGTQTSTQVVAQDDPAETAITATLDFAFSVQPTVSGNYFRRAHIAPVIGASFVWSWWNGSGLVVPGSAGIGIVTPTALAGQPLELWVVVED